MDGGSAAKTPSVRRRLVRFSARSLALVVLAALGLVGASTPAVAQACQSGIDSDFDGDGLADLAIADPDATVGSAARSGAVHIAYGDGRTQSISQADIADNDTADGDRFGYALASTDWNGDGCADLFVGAPFEDWANNSVVEAGVVNFIPGSPSGLDPTVSEVWAQSRGTGWGVEAGDRFGWSLAAGIDTAGGPFLLVGSPGEDGYGEVDNGGFVYFRPGAAVGVHQDSPGVFGVLESGDLYGYAVAASPSGFAVGGPGEAVGDEGYAGTVAVFAHNDATAIPSLVGGADQETDGVSGIAEAGDAMGYAIAMVDYLPEGASAPSMVVSVASAGEDGSDGTEDSGYVLEFDADGNLTQRRTLHQDTDDVGDVREAGDGFGSALVAVNRSPGQQASWDDLLLAVGSPGEDDEGQGFADRGAVQLFSILDAAGAHDVDAAPELDRAGIEWQAGMRLGSSLLASQDHLNIADPWSDSPAVYAVPWDNIVADGTDPVMVYTPTDFGLTDAEVASFGAALA
ncbi:hypothetical protein GCM10029992_25350 [Glycomyces albus]